MKVTLVKKIKGHQCIQKLIILFFESHQKLIMKENEIKEESGYKS